VFTICNVNLFFDNPFRNLIATNAYGLFPMKVELWVYDRTIDGGFIDTLCFFWPNLSATWHTASTSLTQATFVIFETQFPMTRIISWASPSIWQRSFSRISTTGWPPPSGNCASSPTSRTCQCKMRTSASTQWRRSRKRAINSVALASIATTDARAHSFFANFFYVMCNSVPEMRKICSRLVVHWKKKEKSKLSGLLENEIKLPMAHNMLYKPARSMMSGKGANREGQVSLLLPIRISFILSQSGSHHQSPELLKQVYKQRIFSTCK